MSLTTMATGGKRNLVFKRTPVVAPGLTDAELRGSDVGVSVNDELVEETETELNAIRRLLEEILITLKESKYL